MSRVLAGLAISVALSIGPFTASLSVDTKGKVKGDVSYATGNYARGRVYCLHNCDPNNTDGTGSYRSLTVGETIQTRTKVYENGATSVDAVVAVKGCDESKIVCVKGAVSERLSDNFDKKEAFTARPSPLNLGGYKPSEVSSIMLASAQLKRGTSLLQPTLSRARFSPSQLATVTFPDATPLKQNEGTKKKGKQLFKLLKAADHPLLRGV